MLFNRHTYGLAYLTKLWASRKSFDFSTTVRGKREKIKWLSYRLGIFVKIPIRSVVFVEKYQI